MYLEKLSHLKSQIEKYSSKSITLKKIRKGGFEVSEHFKGKKMSIEILYTNYHSERQ